MANKSANTDVHEAFRAVVHDFDVAKMAANIGMPVGTLYNKCNLNDSTPHKPTLGESVLVQVIAKDTRIVEAMAETLGGAFIKLPKVKGLSDQALLDMVADISIMSGRFHSELKEAWEDGRFSKAEHGRIHQQGIKYITAILETVMRIEGMVDPDAP